MLLKPNATESKEDFIKRFMADPAMLAEFPENDQRYAVCMKQFEGGPEKAEAGNVLSITAVNELGADGSLFIPFGDTQVIASNGERVIQRHDQAAMNSMVSAFNSRIARFMRKLRGDVPIYVGHPDIPGMEDKFPDKRARGYVEGMNVSADGVRLDPEWTNLGQELRTENQHRYPSPRWELEFTGENVDGIRVTRPVRLISVGMTNRPNIKSVIAYNEACEDAATEDAPPADTKPVDPAETPEPEEKETPAMDPRLQFLLTWLGLAETATEEEIKSAADAKLSPVNSANEAREKAVKDLANERTAWATKRGELEGTIAVATAKLTAANEIVRAERKQRITDALVHAVTAGQLTAADKDQRLTAFNAALLDHVEAVNAAIAEVASLPRKIKTEAVNNASDRKAEAETSQIRITAINEAVGDKMKITGLPYHDAYLAVKTEKPQLFHHQ